MSFRPAMLPTCIGSFPHRDAGAALALVRRHLPECPCWPQLPRRSRLEQMAAQFSEDIPGLVWEDEDLRFDPGADLMAGGEGIYRRYLEGPMAELPVSRRRAEGLYALADDPAIAAGAVLVKGQITGPLTLGLAIVDRDGNPLLYRDDLMDLVVKVLAMRARWQERFLARLHPRTLIAVDEPALATYGSGFFGYDRRLAAERLGEVLGAVSGLRAVHCCANTDWSVVLATPLEVLSFDAWGFARHLALYADEVGAFLERGGMLAWGIVPAGPEAAAAQVPELVDRLEEGIELLAARGVDRRMLLEQAFVTPSCGLGSLDEVTAARALELTRRVSESMWERHRLAPPGRRREA